MPGQPTIAVSLRHPARPRAAALAESAACLLFAAIILAHAGLLPLSRWQGDEYLYVALLHRDGWHFIADRFLHWGPRPWSELLLWLFGVAVNHAHRPLSGRFVSLLWLALGAACVAPAASPATRRLRRLAFGLGLFALYLVGHPLAEMFFWPSGAAAYLLTLAGITWLFWCLATPSRPIPVRQAAAALLLAAGSSELGLFFTFALAGGTFMLAVRRGARGTAWVLPGLSLAGLDLWLLLHGRAGAAEQPGAAGPLFHHAWPSLWQGVAGLPAEMLVSGAYEARPGDAALHAGTLVLALLAGRWCLCPLPRARAGDLAAFIGALVATAVLSRAAADYQFGELCCQRHETMRHCLILLAAVAAGAGSGAVRPPRPGTALAGLAAWAFAAAVLAGPRVQPLIATYRRMPAIVSARAATWRSGLAPGAEMTFTTEPGSPMLPEMGGFAPRVIRLDQSPPWYDLGVLLLFDKRVMTVIRPDSDPRQH